MTITYQFGDFKIELQLNSDYNVLCYRIKNNFELQGQLDLSCSYLQCMETWGLEAVAQILNEVFPLPESLSQEEEEALSVQHKQWIEDYSQSFYLLTEYMLIDVNSEAEENTNQDDFNQEILPMILANLDESLVAKINEIDLDGQCFAHAIDQLFKEESQRYMYIQELLNIFLSI